MIVGVRFIKTKAKFQNKTLKQARIWLYPKMYYFNLNDVKVGCESKPGVTTSLDNRLHLADFVIVKGLLRNGRSGYVIGQVEEIYKKDDIKPEKSILKAFRIDYNVFRLLKPNQSEIRLYKWLRNDLSSFRKSQQRNRKMAVEGKK